MKEENFIVMSEKMNIKEIFMLVKEKRAKWKKCITNYYHKYDNANIEFDVIYSDDCVAFSLKEQFLYRTFFYANDIKGCEECLGKVPSGAVIDFIERKEECSLEYSFLKSGFERYAVYERVTTPIPNPHKLTRIEKLCESMYDPKIGEKAQMSDIPQLKNIFMDVFDPICDGILTDEELKKSIKNGTVWIHKVKERICTIYIYQVEGKKRYGNLTYNVLSANYLYNICKKANEESLLHNEFVMHYGWINCSNKKIKHTLSYVGTQETDGIKNFIYKKK